MEDDARRCGRFGFDFARHFLKHPINHADVQVHMLIQAGAESVDEYHRADVQRCLVRLGRTGAVGLQALRN